MDVREVYPKLCNINLWCVTPSLIPQNPRKLKLSVQISLCVVTFPSHLSRVLTLMQTTEENHPHPCIVLHVNMWSVFILLLMPLVELLVDGFATLRRRYDMRNWLGLAWDSWEAILAVVLVCLFLVVAWVGIVGILCPPPT